MNWYQATLWKIQKTVVSMKIARSGGNCFLDSRFTRIILAKILFVAKGINRRKLAGAFSGSNTKNDSN